MLCPYFYPEATAAAVRATHFAKFFAMEGIEVQVITPKTNRITPEKDFQGLEIDQVESYDSMRETHGFIWSAFHFLQSVKKIRRKLKETRPDIVMTTTPSPFFAYQGHLACKKLKIPVVFDVRDTWLLQSVTHKGRISNYIKGKIEGQCCWGAKKILIVTRMLGDQLLESHKLPQNKLFLAPNGADLETFSMKKEPDVDIIILGAPSIYRNFEAVFQSLSYLIKIRPSTTIRYIGWTDNPYTNKLKTLIQNFGILNQVELTPPIPHSEVPQALSKARVGLISFTKNKSLYSAVGAKTYEYMAAGLPLACFGPLVDCELKRLINETNAGIYESEPIPFAKRLKELLENSSLLKSFAEKSKNSAMKYDRKQIAKQVYQDVFLPIQEGKI